MNYFANNLRHLRMRRGMEQLELAERLGRKSSSSISSWEKGLYAPKAGVLNEIANIFNVSLTELMTEDMTDVKPDYQPACVQLPVVNQIACGNPSFIQDDVVDYKLTPPDVVPSGEAFYLIANGESMSPAIPDRSHVLMRKQDVADDGQIVAVVFDGESEATLKRIKYQNDDYVLLIPENNQFDVIVGNENNPFRIVGVAQSVTVNL